MLDKSIQVGIVGLGMIGGSIAKSLTKKGYKVFADDLDKNSLSSALSEGSIDGFLEDLNCNNNFILILTVPILSAGKELLKNKELISKALLVSDALSVKGFLREEIDRNKISTKNFVLSHPIAGSEKSGYINSKEDLFKNKIAVVTQLQDSSKTAIDMCNGLWDLLGAKTINLNTEDHDKYFSKTSHLPHLIAFALISMISKSDQIQKDTFTGGGLKDFTRIASSDPKMWEDIFLSNQINILEALKRFKTELGELEKLIEDKDSDKINQFIEDAKKFRDSMI